MKEVLLCFMCIKENTLGENCKEAYELWRDRNPTRINIDAKLPLNQKNYILKAKRITAVETEEIKEDIRLKIWNDTEDHTRGINGNTMNTNDTQHQKKDEESNSTGLGKTENNNQEQKKRSTVRNKLKEDLQILWHKVRLLQMHERDRLPKSMENSKLIKLKDEINGII